jgi:hypothetical protein
MRIIALISFLFSLSYQSYGQYITEIDYDNVSTDNAEFVEMFFATGVDPSDYSLLLYNGSNGSIYGTINSTSFTCTSITGGSLCVWDPPGSDNLQNEAEGIVLWNNVTATAAQAFAYEGDFTPINGPASGIDLILLGFNDSNTNNVSLQDHDRNGVFILAIPSSGVLPVKLKAPMTVTQKGRDVEASWTTASEINNSHFDVEHSLDGINYDVIGIVQGSNETDFDKAYKFTHKNAPESVNFYRLTQHDFDGKSETFDATSIDVVAEGGFLIYPTHTHDFINVRGNIDGASIYDATGKFILFTKGDKQIDVSNFNKGMYLLKSGTKVAKFVKL